MARAPRFGRSLRSASNRRASFDDLAGRFAPRGSAPLPRLVEGPIARCGRYAEGTQSPPHHPRGFAHHERAPGAEAGLWASDAMVLDNTRSRARSPGEWPAGHDYRKKTRDRTLRTHMA